MSDVKKEWELGLACGFCAGLGATSILLASLLWLALEKVGEIDIRFIPMVIIPLLLAGLAVLIGSLVYSAYHYGRLAK